MVTIGITLGKEGLKVALLKKEKKMFKIDALHTIPYGPDDVKQFYNLPPFHTGKEVQIVSGLASTDILIRKLHLPLRERRKILAALPFQLESLLPFTHEKPLICPLLKPVSKQMTAITVVASTQEYLSAHLFSLKDCDIEPSVVSCIPTALMRFATWQFPQEARILSFDIHELKMTCVVSEKTEIILSQTLVFSDRELEKLSIFLKQKGVINEDTPWIVTGDVSCAEEAIAQTFPGRRLTLSDAALLAYASTIGLGLDALIADENSLQFCQKAFTPEHTFQRRKKKAFAYFGFCMGLAALMGVSSFLMLGNKQELLAKRLETFMPSAKAQELCSLERLQTKIFEWETAQRNQKNTFAFVPTVPKVSDVLAWLSSHPSFSTELGESKEGMQIKSLHYSLVKYPQIGEPLAPYAAQLEMEFSSTAPRLARDFHDALLKGDSIVNSKAIKWHTQNQTYNASFELNKGVPQ